MLRRLALFVVTNAAVIALLTVVLAVLDAAGVLDPATIGMHWGVLLVFAAVLGMGGALISLALSKTMAKRMTGCRVIDTPGSPGERWLLDTVRHQARQAGIGMPEVAIYDAPEINAFATGARSNNALVAVSTGLLRRMNRAEAEAVLGHEVSHIANGDMITLTLIQGVLNTFVIFLAHVIGRFVDRAVFRSEHGHGPGFWIATLVAQLVLGLAASMIVMGFSRWREFGADRGGARLGSRRGMIAALEKLKGNEVASSLPDEVEAFGISGRMGRGLARLFMSHPPLDERIAALQREGDEG